METETGGTRASAVRAWIADTAAASSTERYGDGLREGLLVGLTLARLEPEWSSAALDELIASSAGRCPLSLWERVRVRAALPAKPRS